MRIQTWALRAHIQSDGALRWDLVHSTYGKTGRQLPQQVAAGWTDNPAQLAPIFDQLADAVVMSYRMDDGAAQLPLFFS